MANQTSTTRFSAGQIPRMTDLTPFVSVRRPDLGRQRGNLFITALVLRLAGVGLLAWIGYIHWWLWSASGGGYKFIPTDGPFFLIDAIAGIVLAVVLLA